MRLKLITLCLILLAPFTLAEWWHGGAGIEARQQLETKDYNTKIVLTNEVGTYLAGVNFSIYDDNNVVVFKSVSDGPWIIGSVAAGNYRIEGKRFRNDDMQSMDFTVVNGKVTTVYVRFANDSKD